jgi:hypothetical protein
MASNPYFTIPTYTLVRSGGKKVAKFEADLVISKERLVALSIDTVGVTNLGNADWDTIIDNNEELEELLDAVKDGLIRVWLRDVETGTRSVLTSADWITEIAEEYSDEFDYGILPTYSESPKFRGVNLNQNVIFLLNSGVDKWTDGNVVSITAFTKPVLNSEDSFYLVKTDFGLEFIVDQSGYSALLGIAAV